MPLRPDEIYHEQRIQDFIRTWFNEEELKDFCLAYFPQVYDEFTLGMPRSLMVRLLVDECRRHDRMVDLTAALQRERPQQFQEQLAWAGRQGVPTSQPQAYTSRQRNQKQIFLSHAHQDAAFAQQLAQDLRVNGWTVWIAPDSIRPGEKWVEAINRGLEESGLFLLIVTANAVNSDWVRREVDVAIELQHEGMMRVIPLDVQRAAVPPLWRTYQRISFRGSYSAGWQALQRALNPAPPGAVEARPVAAGAAAAAPQPKHSRRFPLWLLPVLVAIALLVSVTPWLPALFSRGNDPNGALPTATEGVPTTEGLATEELAASVEVEEEPGVLLGEPDEPLPEAEASVAVATATPTPDMTPTPTQRRVTLPHAVQTRSVSLPGGQEVSQVFVPAGSFLMGSTADDSFADEDEFPAHEVFINDFWIDQTEVTNAQFAAFLTEEGNQMEGPVTWLEVESPWVGIEANNGGFQPKAEFANYPVIEVSWYGARAYCEWAGGRLPTEAEWEYAARGPNSLIYPWGNEPDCELATYGCPAENNRIRYLGLLAVGGYADGASWTGALDMSGNVWEWVNDWYANDYYEAASPENPTGPENGNFRVVRGGGNGSNETNVRAANRNGDNPVTRDPETGFRCVQE